MEIPELMNIYKGLQKSIREVALVFAGGGVIVSNALVNLNKPSAIILTREIMTLQFHLLIWCPGWTRMDGKNTHMGFEFR